MLNLQVAAADHPRGYDDFALGMDIMVTSVRFNFLPGGLITTDVTAEPVVTSDVDGTTVIIPQVTSTDWASYMPPYFSFDSAFGDYPLAGDVVVSSQNGEMIIAIAPSKEERNYPFLNTHLPNMMNPSLLSPPVRPPERGAVGEHSPSPTPPRIHPSGALRGGVIVNPNFVLGIKDCSSTSQIATRGNLIIPRPISTSGLKTSSWAALPGVWGGLLAAPAGGTTGGRKSRINKYRRITK